MAQQPLSPDPLIQRRKKDHIDICLNKPVEPFPAGHQPLDAYNLAYRALPEIDLARISTETRLDPNLPVLSAPIMISSMTGGEAHGRTINENIAQACEAEGLAFGLGSMRIIDRYPATASTFDVKHLCPSVPMFANIGLVQFNYGFTPEKVGSLISRVRADGLCVHINHLQEAVQPEGDTNFSNLFAKLKILMDNVRVPVIVKEVGHGIDRPTAARLRQECGVRLLDVSGNGGTSWAWIEGQRRRNDPTADNLGYLFRDAGVPLDVSLQQCRDIDGLGLIAGGGIRHGLHVAKAMALGSCVCTTAALPFLKPSLESAAAVRRVLGAWKAQLRVAMFSCGAADIDELRRTEVVRRSVL